MGRKGLVTLSRPASDTTDKSAPKAIKIKRIGFKGGLEKLQTRRNDITVSDKTTIDNVRKVSKIGKINKKTPMVGGTRQKKVILQDPVLTVKTRDISEEEESSELVSDSENEDMERFCRRMCKKTIEAINDNLTSEELLKRKALKRFQKTREKFVDTITTDFRSKVKANIVAGKFILYQYVNDDLYESFTVQDLLLKPDDPSQPPSSSNRTGLRIISDKVDPFRVVHYTYRIDPKPNSKEHRIIEVTWAIVSKKQARLPPNKLPDKYNRKLKISASPVILKKSESNDDDGSESLNIRSDTI